MNDSPFTSLDTSLLRSTRTDTEPQEKSKAASKPRTGEHPNDATPVLSNARWPERVLMKRIITRNSFEIYEDQMDSLRELAYKEKMQGKVGSMSQMVREAIDTFLATRKQEK